MRLTAQAFFRHHSGAGDDVDRVSILSSGGPRRIYGDVYGRAYGRACVHVQRDGPGIRHNTYDCRDGDSDALADNYRSKHMPPGGSHS